MKHGDMYSFYRIIIKVIIQYALSRETPISAHTRLRGLSQNRV